MSRCPALGRSTRWTSALPREIFLLLEPLSQAPIRPSTPRGRGQRPGRSAPKGERSGRSAERDLLGWSSDPTLADDESARDTYAGDQVVLDPFLREFILLELPMFPLRSDLRSVEDAGIGGALSTTAVPPNPPVDARLAPWRRSPAVCAEARSELVAVPKRRKTSSRRDMRRAHHDKVETPNLIPCPNCSAPMVPHRVCPSCGQYRGRSVGSKGPAKTS